MANVNDAVEQISSEGYARISSMAYLESALHWALKKFQESYFRLSPDEGGNRFRSYARVVIIGNECFETGAQGYMQTALYNYSDGEKVRTFYPLEKKVIRSAILRKLIQVDAEIVQKTGIVPFDGAVRVGIHQVRYQPVTGEVSCSSPPGPHMDDEPIVFIHHLNETSNVTGGENTIGKSVGQFDMVVKLDHPLDTLCVTQRQFHAIVPLGLRSGEVGYRDILLVTFQPETEPLPETKKRLFIVL